MEESITYSPNHDVNVETKLPMNVLCYNNSLYDILSNEPLVTTVVELDDKSFTIVCDSKLISSVETLFDVESNRLEYSVVRNNRHANSLKIRTNHKLLNIVTKDSIIIIKHLYIANIKPPNGSGILFLISDMVDVYKDSDNNTQQSSLNYDTKGMGSSIILIDSKQNFDPEHLKESIYVTRMHWYTYKSVEENLHNTLHIAIKNLDIETLVDMLQYKGYNGKYVYDITKDNFYMIKSAMTSSTEEVVMWLISRIQYGEDIPQCPREMILEYIQNDYQLIIEFIQRIKYDCNIDELKHYVITWVKNKYIPYNVCITLLKDIKNIDISFLDPYM